MSTHNLCFDQKYEKYQNFYLKIVIFWWLKCSVYLNRRVFVMKTNVAGAYWNYLTDAILSSTHNR